MRILFINGSPRKNGLISKMLDVMLDEATALGAQTEFIRVNELTISPCKGCMACRKSKKCFVYDDDAQIVLQKIKEADALVIGSPCYWGNMNGYMKVMFDRMVYGMMDENKYGMPVPLHKGKKAIIVTTSTTRWPFNILFNQTRGVIRAVNEILKYSGFKVKATFQKGNTHKQKVLTKREINSLRKKIKKVL